MYTPTVWVDDQAPPINAANLNKMEQGIADASAGGTPEVYAQSAEPSVAVVSMWADTTAPQAPGSASAKRSVFTISGNQILAAAAGMDYVYVCTAGLTATLPTAVANSSVYTIKRTGTGSVVVNMTSSQTIDGLTSYTLGTRYQSVDLISDGANWVVITNSMPAFTPSIIGSEFNNDPNSAAALTANRAQLHAVTVHQPCSIIAVSFVVGTASGNMDVGLYDRSGARLVSSGSTTVPAAGGRTIAVAGTAISPGVYYLALVADNATATFARASIDALVTSAYADASFPLPASLTPIKGGTRTLAIVGNISGGV